MAEIPFYLLLFPWLLSVILLIYILRNTTKSSRLGLPPSPPALPIIGNLHQLSRPLYQGFQQLSLKYGALLYLRLGAFKCLLISSSSLGKEIFKTHDVTFSYKLKSPFEDMLIFGNYGFFNAPYGDYWKFMKKLSVELLGTRQLQRSYNVRREELIRFLIRVVEKAYKGEPVGVLDEITKFTNDATSRMILGCRCEEAKDENCIELVLQSIELARKMTLGLAFPPLKRVTFWLYGKQAMDVVKRFDALTESKLKKHEERAKRDDNEKDFIDLLLEVCNDEQAEVRITRNHIKAFILDLFAGGTTTIAETMQWTMAFLINHPRVFKKLREDIEAVVGKRLVEESDIPNLPYLQAVVKETLRLCPALPIIPRACVEDCKIGDFNVPKGTAILINAYAMMRDPNIWDEPDVFKPERFLDSSNNERDAKGLNFMYLPFGVGRRLCIGQTFAHYMIGATIGAMVQCFEWKPCGGKEGCQNGKVSMEAKSEIIFSMLHPLTCVPVVHFDPFAA